MKTTPPSLARSLSIAFLAGALGLVVGPNCGGSKQTSSTDGGVGGSTAMAGGDGAGGLDVGSGGSGDGVACVGLDELCEASVECCGGRRCEADGNGTKRCIDESICSTAGTTCTRASDCCSLSCDEGTCLDDGSVCKPVETECASDAECCSNDCQGTCQPLGEGCSPLGEVCSSEGFDAGCCSKNCENFGSAEEPDLRCARSSTCGARGEICSEASDCCSGVCLDGRCPTQNEVNGALFAGEPCEKDSDCASYACASSVPGGPKVCQFLGGCRPAGEICSESWQCCSNVQLLDGGPGNFCQDEGVGTGCVAHAIDGLATCDLQDGPKEIGEICKDTEGNAVHDCCPSPNCEETLTGVWRCSGADGFDECRGDGESCQTADQCCSKICSPVETEDGIVLQCGQCVESGGLCTANGDCCGGNCTDGVCDGESTCKPLGNTCETASDCCSGYCSDGLCSTVVVR